MYVQAPGSEFWQCPPFRIRLRYGREDSVSTGHKDVPSGDRSRRPPDFSHFQIWPLIGTDGGRSMGWLGSNPWQSVPSVAKMPRDQSALSTGASTLGTTPLSPAARATKGMRYRDFRAAAASGGDHKDPADIGGRFPARMLSRPSPADCLFPSRTPGRIETDPIVLDRQLHEGALLRQGDRDVAGAGVFLDVSQGFLENPIQASIRCRACNRAVNSTHASFDRPRPSGPKSPLPWRRTATRA